MTFRVAGVLLVCGTLKLLGQEASTPVPALQQSVFEAQKTLQTWLAGMRVKADYEYSVVAGPDARSYVNAYHIFNSALGAGKGGDSAAAYERWQKRELGTPSSGHLDVSLGKGYRYEGPKMVEVFDGAFYTTATSNGGKVVLDDVSGFEDPLWHRVLTHVPYGHQFGKGPLWGRDKQGISLLEILPKLSDIQVKRSGALVILEATAPRGLEKKMSLKVAFDPALNYAPVEIDTRNKDDVAEPAIQFGCRIRFKDHFSPAPGIHLPATIEMAQEGSLDLCFSEDAIPELKKKDPSLVFGRRMHFLTHILKVKNAQVLASDGNVQYKVEIRPGSRIYDAMTKTEIRNGETLEQKAERLKQDAKK